MSAIMDPVERLHTHGSRGRWEWSVNTKATSRQSIPALLWALKDMGGVCEDLKGGHASAKLMEHAEKIGMPLHPIHAQGGSNLSTLMANLESGYNAGCIKRQTIGKRTYKITLLLDDDQMPPKPAPVTVKKVADSPPPPMSPTIAAARRPQIGDTRPAPFGRVQPAPRPPSVFTSPQPAADSTERPTAEPTANGGPSPVPEPEPIPLPEPEPDEPIQLVEEVEPELPPLVAVSGDPAAILLQIQQLSMQAFVAIHAEAGDEPTTATTIDPERYASTLEENNRLRSKINELTAKLNDNSHALVAKTKEIRGLRQGLLVAQNNLKTMQENVDLAPQRERDLARLRGNQRFIAEKPEPSIVGRREAARR